MHRLHRLSFFRLNGLIRGKGYLGGAVCFFVSCFLFFLCIFWGGMFCVEVSMLVCVLCIVCIVLRVELCGFLSIFFFFFFLYMYEWEADGRVGVYFFLLVLILN